MQRISILLCMMLPLFSLLAFSVLPRMAAAVKAAGTPESAILVAYLLGGVVGVLLSGALAELVYLLLFGAPQRADIAALCGVTCAGTAAFVVLWIVAAVRLSIEV